MATDPKQTPESDIAKEEYKGPSAVAAAAGEGYIAHFLYAGLGLLGGGAITWMFHKQASSLVNWGRHNLAASIEHGGLLSRPSKFFLGILGRGNDAAIASEEFGKFEAQYRHGFGQWLINHFTFVKPLFKNLNPDRLSTSITTGGIAGAFGFFVMPALLAGKGAHKGNEGKRQFERAKDEIWDLRAENDQLRQHLSDLRAPADAAAPAAPIPAEPPKEDAPAATPQAAAPVAEAEEAEKPAPVKLPEPDATPAADGKPADKKDDAAQDGGNKPVATADKPIEVAAVDQPADAAADKPTNAAKPETPRAAPVKTAGSWGDGIRDQQTATIEKQATVA